MNAHEVRQRADTRFNAMLEARADYEKWWQDLSRQFAPNRGRFHVSDRPRKGIIRRNSRPRTIPDDFASGIKSGLTSPSRKWFTLTLSDDPTGQPERVKAWLTDVENIIRDVMIRTNLYDQLFDVYKEQGIFGTGALLIEDDDEKVFRCTSLTIGSYVIDVDERGIVNRFGRQFNRTARQLAAEFGAENLPQEIQSVISEDRDGRQEYELRHLIEPSEDFRRGDGPGGVFRWRSLWWLKGFSSPEFLRVGGYNEFPVMVPRWRVINGDLYGREQPGDIGLDDARTIQELEADERSAIKKSVRPPVMMPAHLLDGELQDYPGGVTVYMPQSVGGNTPITPLYAVQFDHQSVAQKRTELIMRLEETFYVNFFRMWTSDLRLGRTATEIQARESEKMYMLGPLIERQMSELLDPLIDRVFGIVARAGLIPPPPEEVQGRNVRPEYTSVLANVQKQTSHSGMEIIMSTVGALAQLQGGAGRSPDVLDKLDCDEFIDQLADMYALPAGLVLGDDVVAQNREARKQQEAQQAEQMQMAQEAQAMAAAAPQLSRAARDAGETPLGGGSVLDALTGGGGVE